nr:LacI family DNA-binding transcriptional regulator [Planctomonas sp. JC2975]
MITGVDAAPLASRVTITDVARAAGVSVATVSKVINERYGVAPATIEKVTRVVEELGYESSLVASSLRRHRTNVIGILVAGFEPYSVELLKGVSAAAHDTQYELLAYSGPLTDVAPSGWERRSLSRLAGTLIDGAIVVTPTETLPSTSIPVVAIDPHAGRGGPATVDSDNRKGARTATEYLIELGHRRIAHIQGRGDLESSRLRELGYRDALKNAGIPFDEALLAKGEYRQSDAEDAARTLLALPDPPTAIFAANDLSALGVLHVAEELGLQVPRDLSVMGYDDIPDAASSSPPLTTIAQPLARMGAEALQMLTKLLAGKDAARHRHLQARLVVRGTTAASPQPAAVRP